MHCEACFNNIGIFLDPQMSQTAVARLPVHSAPSAAVAAASGPLHQQPGIKTQNFTVLPHQVFQKGTGTRPILTVNGQNLIPVQVSQGQAIILNSAGQSIIAKPTILPKGSSPDKLMSSQASSAQVYLPLSFVNTDSKLSVRSIAPRGVGATIRNVEPEKRKLQPQVCSIYTVSCLCGLVIVVFKSRAYFHIFVILVFCYICEFTSQESMSQVFM